MNTLYTNAQNNLRLKPLAAGLAFVFGVSAALAGHATTRIVNNCDDRGAGSLRDTVAGARSGDTIDLTALTCSTISLTTGHLDVVIDDLTLQGPGASALTIAGATIINDFGDYEYFALSHSGHGTLRIDALRITHNSQNPTTCVYSAGTVYLNRSTVTACRSGVVAKGFSARDSTVSNNVYGVQTLDGNVSITGSTISGNTGGGLHLGDSSTVGVATAQITNTTISGNSAYHGYGAGTIFDRVTISNSTIAFNHTRTGISGLGFFAPVVIESSIFAHNDGFDLIADGGYGLPAPVISGHDNLIMAANVAVPADTIKTDPQLLPLANNGGTTWTHALSLGSPAIDAGNNSAVLATDQRGAGYARVAGLRADIGAFETQSSVSPNAFIGPAFTGAWYDPNQSGHGLAIEVLNNNLFYAMWFAFAPDGSQAWFGGVGTYVGNTAVIEQVAEPEGGRWIPNFDPSKIVRNPWGTLTFTFSDCNHGRVDFNSTIAGFGANHMDLSRLTQPAGLTCP